MIRQKLLVLAAGVLLGVAAFAPATGESAVGAGGPQVSVYFVQGEQLAPVNRPGATALDAARQLVAGPIRAERGRGFRTYIPAGTQVRSVGVANGIATVDLSESFVAASSP